MPNKKSSEFHVGMGGISGTIYAGTLMRNGTVWKDRSDVTEEAIGAVRDHMIEKAREKNVDSYGFSWKHEDGGSVQLIVRILPKEAENGSDENV